MKRTFRVGSHFLSAIINRDFSGLDINESEKLLDFEKASKVKDWICPDESSNIGYAKCDITQLYNECFLVDTETY